MRKPKTAKEISYWQGIINDWEKSDSSQQRFCEERQLNFISFKNWRYRLSRNELNKQKSSSVIAVEENLIPVQIRPTTREDQTAKEIKLIFPNGLQCALPGGMEVNRIGQLVEVLLSC